VGYISANDPQLLELENLGRFICGQEADIGHDKVIAAARFLHRNPHLAFEPVIAGNESPSVNSLFEWADWIFSCANSVSARIAVTRKRFEVRKPIINVGVSDGMVSLAGSIKYWLPERADCSACPACSLASTREIPRNEGLLFTVLGTTAALATYVFVTLAAGPEIGLFRANNTLTVDMDKCKIERLAVLKRKKCPICSNHQE
jgi:molybdopterin/thiamine biosynthesis adenylyltransferase